MITIKNIQKLSNNIIKKFNLLKKLHWCLKFRVNELAWIFFIKYPVYSSLKVCKILIQIFLFFFEKISEICLKFVIK